MESLLIGRDYLTGQLIKMHIYRYLYRLAHFSNYLEAILRMSFQGKRSLLVQDNTSTSVSASSFDLMRAGRVLTEFIGNSYSKLRKVFKIFGSRAKENQTQPGKEEQNKENNQTTQKTGNRIFIFDPAALPAPNQQTDSQQLVISQKRLKYAQSKAQPNQNTLLQNPDHLSSRAVQLQLTQKSKLDTLANEDKKLGQQTDIQKQEAELETFMKGSKKVKTQQMIKATKEQAVQVYSIMKQSPETAQHFRNLASQLAQSLSRAEAFKSIKIDQKASSIGIRIQKIQEIYQAMKKQPKKSEAVKQRKNAQEMMLQMLARQENIQKRFIMYREQKKKKLRERLSVHKLKLENIVPTYQKIIQQQRQEKLRKQSQKEVQKAAAAPSKLAENLKKPQLQDEQHKYKDKKPLLYDNGQLEQPKSIIQPRLSMPGVNLKTLGPRVIENKIQIPQQGNNIEKSMLVNNASHIVEKVQPIKQQKPSLKQLKEILIKKGEANLQNMNKIQQKPIINYKTNEVQGNTQQPNKPAEKVELGSSNNSKTVLPVEPPSNTKSEPLAQKHNPFKDPIISNKLSITDLIFSQAHKVPKFQPTNSNPTPSAAAEIFISKTPNFTNLFANLSPIQAPVQQNSNFFTNPTLKNQLPNIQPAVKNNIFSIPQNPSRIFSSTPPQANNGQTNYQPNIFANPERSRSMFQNTQASNQSGLFSQQSSSHASYNNNRSSMRAPARNRKNKDMRIC